MRKRTAAVSVITAMLASMLLAAVPAHAGPEGDFVSMINAERRSRGLRELSVRGDLADVARRHAKRMASQGRLYHNPNLHGEVSGWKRIGENVGRGSSARAIHRGFMSSSSHRAVILQPDFNQVGVGVAWRGDELYVSEVFAERGSSRTARSKPRVEERSTSTQTSPRTTTRATRSTVRPRPAEPPRARRTVTDPQRALRTVRALRRMSQQDADIVVGT